jgi:hypothetical protein
MALKIKLIIKLSDTKFLKWTLTADRRALRNKIAAKEQSKDKSNRNGSQ